MITNENVVQYSEILLRGATWNGGLENQGTNVILNYLGLFCSTLRDEDASRKTEMALWILPSIFAAQIFHPQCLCCTKAYN